MLWLTILFVIAAIGWASQAEIDEVTKGSGKVIPSRQIQVVQNLEGGIVSEIMIREGEIVDPGQVLLRIDDTRFSSSFRERVVNRSSLEARLARLRAEAEGGEFSPSKELVAASPAAVNRERSLFASHQEQLVAQVDVFKQQEVQKRQELQELRSRLSGLRANQNCASSARRSRFVPRSTPLASPCLGLRRPWRRSGAASKASRFLFATSLAKSSTPSPPSWPA